MNTRYIRYKKILHMLSSALVVDVTLNGISYYFVNFSNATIIIVCVLRK
jgi:hypothetical protein